MRVFLYTKLTKALLNELASGVYHEGARFLSNRKICQHWKVSQPTAASSLSWLAEKGLLEVRQRSGVYVTARSRTEALRLLYGKGGHSLSPQPDWELKRLGLRAPRVAADRKISVILSGMDVTLESSSQMPSPEVVSELVVSSAQALVREASRRKYSVEFLIDNGRPDRREIMVRNILAERPEGVIAFRRLPFYIPMQPIIAPLASAGIPVLTVFDDCEGLKVTSISVNNIGVGYNAVTRLMRLGHRRIAILLPKEENPYFRDRAVGARMAVDEKGGREVTLTEMTLHTVQPFPAAVSRLFRDPERRPSALFVTSASLFSGLWPLLRAQKLRVPRDVSIIMVAGNPEIPVCGRKLDVMKIDFPRLGRMAACHLGDLLDGHPQERCTMYNPSYQANGSVRAIGRS